MAVQVYNFDDAFNQLTAEVESQAAKGGIVSFDQAVIEPFKSTNPPLSSDGLQKLAKLFAGQQKNDLFMRLDGPAIYLVVSTILEFPYSLVLSKLAYFLMDNLAIYKSNSKVYDALRPFIDDDELEKEIKKRQSYIFSHLLRRLREILLDDGKQVKVRRLVAQLIMTLCMDNASGWRNLMKNQKDGLFGTLFRRLDDYVLRFLLADIIRHLRAHNFEMLEIWQETDEHAMDFPASQEIHSKGLDNLMTAMSGMELKRGFKESTSRIYRLCRVNLNIPSRPVQIVSSDIFLTLDDSISILVPDMSTGRTTFYVYEVPIIEEMLQEQASNAQGPLSLRVHYTEDKGYTLLRGKKFILKDMNVTFVKEQNVNEFSRDLANILNGLKDSSEPEVAVSPRPRDATTGLVHVDFGTAEADLGEEIDGTTPVTKRLEQRNQEQAAVHDAVDVVSSSSFVQGEEPLSDAFAAPTAKEQADREHRKIQNKQDKSNAGAMIGVDLIEQFRAVSSQHLQHDSCHETPAAANSDESDCIIFNRSSPLKASGKRKREQGSAEEEGTAKRLSTHTCPDPALTVALDQVSDPDFAVFQSAGSKDHLSVTGTGNVSSSQQFPLHLSQGQSASQCRQVQGSAEAGRVSASELRIKARSPVKEISKRGQLSQRAQSLEGENTSANKPDANEQASSRAASKPDSTLSSLDSYQTLDPPVVEKNHKSRSISKPSNMMPLSRQKSKSKPKSKDSNVDWDQGLRNDDGNEEDASRSNPKARAMPKAAPKKVLKDSTNTKRKTEILHKPLVKGRPKIARGRSKAAPPLQPAEITAASRRPQRAVTKKATTYTESSESELEDEDVADKDNYQEPSNHDKVSQKLRKPHATPKVKTAQVPSSELASRSNQTLRQRISTNIDLMEIDNMTSVNSNKGEVPGSKGEIMVPSSDSVDECFDTEAQETRISSRCENAKQSQLMVEDGLEMNRVVQDSYPQTLEDGQLLLPGNADGSFGTKLKNLTARTSEATARQSAAAIPQSARLPLGNKNHSGNNSNAARSSVSPVETPLSSTAVQSKRLDDTKAQQVVHGENYPLNCSLLQIKPATKEMANEEQPVPPGSHSRKTQIEQNRHNGASAHHMADVPVQENGISAEPTIYLRRIPDDEEGDRVGPETCAPTAPSLKSMPQPQDSVMDHDSYATTDDIREKVEAKRRGARQYAKSQVTNATDRVSAHEPTARSEIPAAIDNTREAVASLLTQNRKDEQQAKPLEAETTPETVAIRTTPSLSLPVATKDHQRKSKSTNQTPMTRIRHCGSRSTTSTAITDDPPKISRRSTVIHFGPGGPMNQGYLSKASPAQTSGRKSHGRSSTPSDPFRSQHTRVKDALSFQHGTGIASHVLDDGTNTKLQPRLHEMTETTAIRSREVQPPTSGLSSTITHSKNTSKSMFTQPRGNILDGSKPAQNDLEVEAIVHHDEAEDLGSYTNSAVKDHTGMKSRALFNVLSNTATVEQVQPTAKAVKIDKSGHGNVAVLQNTVAESGSLQGERVKHQTAANTETHQQVRPTRTLTTKTRPDSHEESAVVESNDAGTTDSNYHALIATTTAKATGRSQGKKRSMFGPPHSMTAPRNPIDAATSNNTDHFELEEGDTDPRNTPLMPANDTLGSVYSDELVSDEELELKASAAAEPVAPSEPRRTALRNTPAPGQASWSAKKEQGRDNVQPPSSTLRERSTRSMKDMAQTLTHGLRGLGDLSKHIQSTYTPAHNENAPGHTVQTHQGGTIPHTTNVFGARSPTKPGSSIKLPLSIHAHTSHPMFQTPALRPATRYDEEPPPKKARISRRFDMTAPSKPVIRSPLQTSDRPIESASRLSEEEQTRCAQERLDTDEHKATSHIKRVGRVLSAAKAQPCQTLPLMCTPQPFLERLYAVTSPISATEPSVTLEARQIRQDHPDSAEITLVEPLLLHQGIAPGSASLTSTQVSESSISSEPEHHRNVRNSTHQGHSVGAGPVNQLHQILQQAVAALTQDVLTRIEEEEQAAKNLVRHYRGGCEGVLDELKQNAVSRLRHDATKVKVSIKQIRDRTTRARKTLNNMVLPDGQPIEPMPPVSLEDVRSREDWFASILDKVQ